MTRDKEYRNSGVYKTSEGFQKYNYHFTSPLSSQFIFTISHFSVIMDDSQHGIRAIHGLTKFNGRDDFHIWKFSMERHLGRAGLIGMVKEEKDSSMKDEQWEK